METILIINRLEEWFKYEDTALDPFYFAITLLERLNGRKKMGFIYNRASLITQIVNRKSQEALRTLDAAIVLLSSRKLISIEEHSNNLNSIIYITPKGTELVDAFRKELKNVHS